MANTESLKAELDAGDTGVFRDYVEYKIPAWALCAMVNGDTSGLEDDDIAALTEFEEDNFYQFGAGTWDFEEEEYFSHTNDVGGLGCDVVDATYFIDA